MSISPSKQSLPSLIDSKYIRDQVTRLIRNKIQPLAFKYHVLKSGRCLTKQQKISQTVNVSLKDDSIQKCNNTINVLKNVAKKRNRRTQHKQNNIQGTNSPVVVKKRRRGALVQATTIFDRYHFKLLQSKVQNHIMLKRMNLMQQQFTQAEQSNKKQREQICHKLRTSPLQKYLQIFQKSQRTSQKQKKVKQSSCQQMLKQIKSAKSIKHIECIHQNMGNMVNVIDKKSHSHKQRSHQQSNKKLRTNNRKLKQEIMTDIKKQYQNQGSAKIRISINHKKMIQIL